MTIPLHIQIDRHSGLPVYRQLVDQVRFQATAGTLEIGTELPSTRALGLELGVNPMTISKAYGELERLGVIERRPGKPNVVSARLAGTGAADAEDELRRALQPAVVAIRQLGVTTGDALRALEDLLESDDQEPRSPGDPTP